MRSMTADELSRWPRRLIDSIRHGEAVSVGVAGEAVLTALPMRENLDSQILLVDLAAALFDCDRISLGLAARIAGVSYTEMVDELGRRDIAVIRLGPGELDRELAAFGD